MRREGDNFAIGEDQGAGDPRIVARARADALSDAYDGLSAEAALALAIHRDFRGEVALVSSFGAESAVLLDMVARVAPATPVIMVDTGKLFPETLEYARDLIDRLGLSEVRRVGPDPAELAREDPRGDLHGRDPDACCNLRKVRPLDEALDGFRLWISGRKRHQAATRAKLTLFEEDGPTRFKLNPLADWSREDVVAYVRRRNLPPHPLVAQGYPSIGCAPCTSPVAEGEDARAGRWRDSAKTECGIHLVDGRWVSATSSSL